MKYRALESEVFICAMLTKDNKNLEQIAHYLCADIDRPSDEYDLNVRSVYSHLKRLKKSLFEDEFPVTDEKIKNVKRKLQVYTC